MFKPSLGEAWMMTSSISSEFPPWILVGATTNGTTTAGETGTTTNGTTTTGTTGTTTNGTTTNGITGTATTGTTTTANANQSYTML